MAKRLVKPEKYHEAIKNCKRGLTQLLPDGNNCAICGDSGHQAFDCHHNPALALNLLQSKSTSWQCFSCGQWFHDESSAAAHFGSDRDQPAACKKQLNLAMSLIIRLHGEGVLSEGQVCKALELDRVEFRRMVDAS